MKIYSPIKQDEICNKLDFIAHNLHRAGDEFTQGNLTKSARFLKAVALLAKSLGYKLSEVGNE